MSRQVRDVEAALQEAVLDQVDALLLGRAAAALAPGKSVDAAASVKPILEALTEPRAAARVSLSQAMASMAAKKRLKGDKAAKGLQNIINGLGTCPHQLLLPGLAKHEVATCQQRTWKCRGGRS